MNYYKIEQKLSLSVYPSIHLFSNIVKLDESAKNEIGNKIYMKRTISDLASYNINAAEMTIAYLAGFMELIDNNAIGAIEDGEETLSETLYGFIYKTVADNKIVYLLNFALCDDIEKINEIKNNIIEVNNISDDGIWRFTYGEGVKRNVLNMLYDKCAYTVIINQNVSPVIMTTPQPDYDTYICTTQAVKAKNLNVKEETENE